MAATDILLVRNLSPLPYLVVLALLGCAAHGEESTPGYKSYVSGDDGGNHAGAAGAAGQASGGSGGVVSQGGMAGSSSGGTAASAGGGDAGAAQGGQGGFAGAAAGTGGADAGVGGSSGDAGSAGTSGSAGTGGSAGMGGSAGAGGAGGSSSSCSVQDDTEPNDMESLAQHVTNITDDDDKGASIAGTLAGNTDVDWFTYRAADIAFHKINPEIAYAGAKSARVCAYFECANGKSIDITCKSGSQEQTSPSGVPGCCITASLLVLDYNCKNTTDETAIVHVSVKGESLAPDDCLPYTIDYHN